MTVRIYTASKLYMWEAWRELRTQQIDVEFTARWVDMAHVEVDNPNQTSKFFENCWQIDLADVERADVVLCYGASEDILVGALIEAGAALGMGKIVICVGGTKSFGTWKHHPSVYMEPTVMKAIDLAKRLFG